MGQHGGTPGDRTRDALRRRDPDRQPRGPDPARGARPARGRASSPARTPVAPRACCRRTRSRPRRRRSSSTTSGGRASASCARCARAATWPSSPTRGRPGSPIRASASCARRARKASPSSPCPAPSAAVAALSVSGLPTDRFLFVGFLPARTQRPAPGHRRTLAAQRETLVVYEAPTRVVAALADMVELWGDRDAFLCREATKVHEEYVRGSLERAARPPRRAARR